MKGAFAYRSLIFLRYLKSGCPLFTLSSCSLPVLSADQGLLNLPLLTSHFCLIAEPTVGIVRFSKSSWQTVNFTSVFSFILFFFFALFNVYLLCPHIGHLKSPATQAISTIMTTLKAPRLNRWIVVYLFY